MVPIFSQVTSTLQNHYQTTSILSVLKQPGTTASNVYQQTLFNFSLYSFYIFLALKFRSDMVEITTTTIFPHHTNLCAHSHTQTSLPIDFGPNLKTFLFPLRSDICSSIPICNLLTLSSANGSLVDPNYEFCGHVQTWPKPTVNTDLGVYPLLISNEDFLLYPHSPFCRLLLMI